MKLKKLLKDIPIASVKGSREVEITGICANSKLVSPGSLFVAKKGRVDDGNQYISEAVSAGAAAVLTDIYDPSLKNVVQIIHPNAAQIEGAIAAQYYQFPSEQLFMVGITGTNGKTTTAFLIKHLLDKLKLPCGLMGTIEYIIGDHRYHAVRTTPDVHTNHKLLREMCLNGCRAAVMEVTSHAMDQGRVAHIHYDVAIFTNLSLDHLDYHRSMEKYCEAKNLLFRSLGTGKKKSAHAVVNVDSPWHKQILEGCKAKLLTYGIENSADLRASNIHMEGKGNHFDVTFGGKTVTFFSPLVGRFNIYNCLAAIAVGMIRGESLETLSQLLPTFPSVAGRLEPVPNNLDIKIYVDFAHSDDALVNVLQCLREFKKGRLITVFGCGGDRDRTKRPKMAQAAEEGSDICIVTSDNPRSENPEAICQEIVAGFKNPKNHLVEPDRYAAIEKAIVLAEPGDMILIAGKGHEKYQIFAHKTIEFDDSKIAAQICVKEEGKRNKQ